MKSSGSPTVAVGVLALTLFGCADADPASPNDLQAARIELATDAAPQTGALQFRSGFVLKAPGLGGLSAAEVSSDGESVVALSDTGAWFRFALSHDATGELVDVRLDGRGGLRDTRGQIFAEKSEGDAESAARFEDGRLIVGFEVESKVLIYDPDLESAPQSAAKPPGLGGSNSGLEAMTRLADGRLFALSEGGARRNGASPAWIGDGEDWRTVSYAAEDGFRPTGATTLPNGDVLVLERRFSFPANLSARLMRVEPAALDAEIIRGEEIARLAPPLPIDNFEAVTAYSRDGRLFILVISDNNFSLLQRTLLLQFELTN